MGKKSQRNSGQHKNHASTQKTTRPKQFMCSESKSFISYPYGNSTKALVPKVLVTSQFTKQNKALHQKQLTAEIKFEGMVNITRKDTRSDPKSA